MDRYQNRSASGRSEVSTSHHAKRCRTGTSNILRTPGKLRLPRPKRALVLDLPKHLVAATNSVSPAASVGKDHRSRSSTPVLGRGPESPVVRLTRVSVLMTAIHRRNKNQHRNQQFYKYFSILRRCVGKLIELHEQSGSLARPILSKDGSAIVNTAVSIRERFEKESHLHGQREVLEDHIRESIVPPAYTAFSAVVADTQFANLGLVLLSLLADVASVVGGMKRVEEMRPAKTTVTTQTKKEGSISSPLRLVGLSTLVTGPDHGTVVERVYDSDNGVVSETDRDARKQALQGHENGDERGIDLGEAVRRDEIVEVTSVANSSRTALQKHSLDARRLDMTSVSGMRRSNQSGADEDALRTTAPSVTTGTKTKSTESSSSQQSLTQGHLAEAERAKVKKLKKKRKNAIDDLFSGFG